MINIFVLIAMIFLHIVDDYYLQGILAKLKCRSFWDENAPDKMYKYDYIAALIIHSISWSFMVMVIPISLKLIEHKNLSICLMCFLINAVIHCIIDNAKANKHAINLIQDQAVHVLQVVVAWILCVLR